MTEITIKVENLNSFIIILATKLGLVKSDADILAASLIVNLPGSPKSARENLSVILPALPHALSKLKGDPSECGQG